MHTSLQYIKGIGKNRAKILSDEFGLKNCYDIINFYPFRYIDKRKFYKVRDLVESNSYVQIIGFFKSIKYVESNKKFRLEGLFFDGEKEIKVLWFKGLKWVEKSINNKQKVVLFGKVNWFKNTPSMIHPEIEQLNDFSRKKRIRITPIYKSSDKTINSGMSNNFFIKLIDRIFGIDGDGGSIVREYLGPKTISTIKVRLADAYGNDVDLNNAEFSFTLCFTQKYTNWLLNKV